jgi:hypothetical protein
MAFGNSAHGGIAGHLRNKVYVQRVKGSLQPHAGRGYRSFASRVTGADYDHVELFGEGHLWSLF